VWKAAGREKSPYYIHPQKEQFCAFAGLYDVCQRPGGEGFYTFTIITTEADEHMARLHNRMPVILARERKMPG
jgi:putative SOS response-associated peptidase YedK